MDSTATRLLGINHEVTKASKEIIIDPPEGAYGILERKRRLTALRDRLVVLNNDLQASPSDYALSDQQVCMELIAILDRGLQDLDAHRARSVKRYYLGFGHIYSGITVVGVLLIMAVFSYYLPWEYQKYGLAGLLLWALGAMVYGLWLSSRDLGGGAV